MKNKIDSFMLALLWILAITLGGCFWFNTMFGFNIFSAAHWNYLASLQAGQTPVRFTFYISLAVVVYLLIIGEYMIMRPKLRNIHLPKIKRPVIKHQVAKIQPTQPIQQPTTTQKSQVTEPQVAVTPTPTRMGAPKMARPARPFMPRTSTTTPRPITAAPTSAPGTPMLSTPVPSQDNPEIPEIFEKTGYVVKKPVKIKGVPTALIAIGANETMWIGSIGISTTEMRRATDALHQVFLDTLEDIEIDIHSFVINAPDAMATDSDDILMFADIEELREYMNAHKNPPLIDTDDKGNFDAYSEYIDTVLKYIGRI